MQVVVYTTPSCPYCVQVKDFLSQQGIQYNERDVSQDTAAAAEMVRLSGQRGVPVTVVDGTVVVGFDRRHLEQLIGQAQRPHLGAAVTDASSMAPPGQAEVVEGAYIGRLRAGSPAAQAGLQVGDVITAIGGHSVRSAFDLESIIARIKPGQMVSVRVHRVNLEHEVKIRF